MRTSDKYIDYAIIFACALIGICFLEFRDLVYFRDYSIIFEGAYRLSLGQIPFRDFGMPVGPVSFLIPAILFKAFEPNWTYFMWSQQVLNVFQLFLIYCIFSKLNISPLVKRGAVVLHAVLYLTFLTHPWYNVSGWIMMLAAGLFALGSNRISFALAGLFAGLAFLAKQDFGILSFVISIIFISVKSIGCQNNLDLRALKNRKNINDLISNLIVFLLFAALIIFAFIYGTDVEKFGYWFNYGQEPHKHRSLHMGVLLTIAFGLTLVFIGLIFKSFSIFIAAIFITAALVTKETSGLFFTHYYYVSFSFILMMELWRLKIKYFFRLPVIVILSAMLLTGPVRHFYYIFEADRVGEQVRNALIAAAKRGVAVTLLLDGFGCSRLPQAFLVPLTEAGAMVDRFLPKKGRRYLLRNHQKLAVADEARALIGGANISEEYFSADPAAQGWHDLSLLIEGPQAGALARYVDALHIWMRTRRQSIRHLQAVLAASSDHQGPLRWIMGGPFERLNPFARALRADLDGAQRVDMVQAYFAPDFTFLRRLARVARRGRLRVITAAQSDNVTTIAAARHCYGRLLREGAGIYEYRPARLHMKLIVSDNMVYIGSANYDTRSIFLNVELMLRVEDAGFAEKMRGLCADHLPHCQKIDRIWLKRVSGRFRKLRWALAYFLFTSVDYTITRRFNIGPDRRTWRLTDVKAKAH